LQKNEEEIIENFHEYNYEENQIFIDDLSKFFISNVVLLFLKLISTLTLRFHKTNFMKL